MEEENEREVHVMSYLFFFTFSGVAGYSGYAAPLLDGRVYRVNCTSTSPGSIKLCHTYY
jgi:hypothetical protein